MNDTENKLPYHNHTYNILAHCTNIYAVSDQLKKLFQYSTYTLIQN